MQSSFVSTSYLSRPSRVKLFRNENLVTDDKTSRFNRMADSSNEMNQDYAAELLLQMRRIATNELQTSITVPQQDNTVHPISPIQGPKERSIKILHVDSPCIALPNSPFSHDVHRNTSSYITSSAYDIDIVSSSRFRTVSIGGINDLEENSSDRMNVMIVMDQSSTSGAQGHVSPLHLGHPHVPVTNIRYNSKISTKHVMISPSTSNKKFVFSTPRISSTSLQDRYNNMVKTISRDSNDSNIKDEEELYAKDLPYGKLDLRESKDDDHNDDAHSLVDSITKKTTTTTTFTHKYVGENVAPNVKVRDVLRKKFSWKSFPELELYLINHRKQYLECSNAMNYTKAQKNYNNELTQGLLQLAANEGYIFEEFTFAAVRDRIRCFYKSFVQATKKKKRIHHKVHHSTKHKTTSGTTSQLLTSN